MKEISPQDWNYCYGEWECSIIRENHEINSGGWLIEINAHNEHIFGCKTKKCWDLFLSEPLCDSLGNSLN